ncbi:MAG: thymidylate synthase [Weeksellaceae bacterium]
MNLYKPEKYNVVLGKGSNIGLCTCWSDPSLLLKKHENLMEHIAIMGTLYSREGVSVMLRNLALNPQIDTVIVWGNNHLSQTPIGAAGKTLFTSLWEQGIDENHQVKNTSDTIHNQIEPEILEQMRKNITVVDWSEKPIEEVLEAAVALSHKKPQYMQPIEFPEPIKSETDMQPSESVGWAVRGEKLFDSWLAVVDRIMRYGHTKQTEYGSQQKELQAVTWTIQHEDINDFYIPDISQKLQSHIGLDEAMRMQYKEIFLTGDKPGDVAYTYGNRLFDYPENIDQIKYIIAKLKEHIYTRRAYATTFYPKVDEQHDSPPCMTQLQILSDIQGKLNMFVSFRSHDIFKAAIPNAYGLLCLQKYIADEVGVHPGTLTFQSVSAHIYEEDWQDALDIVKCQRWESTKLYFDEHTDLDPRGYTRIDLRDKLIHLELVSPTGVVLFEYSGKSAREVMMKLARLELLSRPDHYGDMTIELVKAELSMKKGLSYVQDKPLILDGIVIK